MVYIRKKKRTYKKKVSKKVPRSMIRSNHTYITRVAQLEPWICNTAWTTKEYIFRLSDLVSYGEFVNLFDQYKISAVKLTFFPRFDGNDLFNANISSGGASVPSMPLIWTVASDDDTNLLFSQSTAMQVSRAKMRSTMKPFSIYVRPKFQVEVGTTLAITAAYPKTGFLDTDNYSVSHFGAQIGGYSASSPSANAGIIYECFAKYYLQLKNAK